MCKIKQLNGDPICTNNYGTKRDYEVLLYIKEHEEVKAGDILKGSEICNNNPTKTLQWEVRECNRVDGGHVVIVDNKEGKVKTFMFVFGKGQKKTTTTKTEQQQATVQEEEETKVQTNNNTTNNSTMNTTANNAQGNNNGIEQVANIFASLQNEAYNNGYNAAQEEAAAKIDDLTAQVEELKNRPTTSGTVINITIEGSTTQKVIQSIVNPNAEELIDYLKEGENVFLWGPAGAGKNVLGEQLAEMLDVQFFYMNTVYTKYDVTGFTDAQGNYVPTAFVNWLNADGGLMFIDEMCTNSPEANTAINALLANKYIVLQNGEVLKMSPRHYVVAADNTNGLGATEEYNGRYKMDESTRDRFAFFFIDYDAAVEESIVGDKKDILDFVRELRNVTKECNISLVLGYRCINRLVKFYNRDAARTIEHNILKGMEQDTINEIAARLTGSTKWHTAFKSLVK